MGQATMGGRRKHLMLAGGAVGLVAIGAGLALALSAANAAPGAPGAAEQTITGTHSVWGLQSFHEGLSCAGSGASNGATVTVYDGAGLVVGTGQLTNARGVESAVDTAIPNGMVSICRFDFTVKVPETDFYRISAGATTDTFSRATLMGNGWRADLA